MSHIRFYCIIEIIDVIGTIGTIDTIDIIKTTSLSQPGIGKIS